METHTIPDREYDTKGQEVNYGFFGYEGAMSDRAMRRDNLPDLKEVIRRGYIDQTSKTLTNQSMVEYADYCKAPKCKAYLLGLGWK